MDQETYCSGSAWLFHVEDHYYVTHDFDEDLCDLLHEAVIVDELIAEPLRLLCNKGYITKYSCSGHPFDTCDYDTLENDAAQKAREEKAKYVRIIERDDADAVDVCMLQDHKLKDEMYVSFEHEYPFQSLPSGWIYEKATLRKSLCADTIVNFYRQVIDGVETLISWINDLPNSTIS